MSYTNGELVRAALEEIGIADYEFDISPEQISSAIRRLNSMLAGWDARGILLSFPIAKEKDAEADADSNIPDWAWEAVITNLAVILGPSYGKIPSNETKVAAKNSLNTVLGRVVRPKEMQFPSMPKGAGYKTTEFRYTPAPQEQYLVPIDEEFDPSGGVE